jgi:GNAT superfamily N-acetyltransferase
MDPTAVIRPAQNRDAVQISALIQHTLRISNAQDYSPAVIDRVADNFTAKAVLDFIRHRIVLVATQAGMVTGTASLDGDAVKTVFVDPDMQRRGIGRQLMTAIEALAQRNGVTTLWVNASLTARPFYICLGYAEVEEVLNGEERTILMEKHIV